MANEFVVKNGLVVRTGTITVGDPAATGYTFPAATGIEDEVLTVNASGDLIFAPVSGSSGGTVTSVNLTAPVAGITVSGGPITSSGSITLALANDLAALEGLTSTGFAVRTTTDTWAQRSIVGTAGKITVTDGDGVSGNPTIDLATAGTAGTYTKVTTDAYGRVTSGIDISSSDVTTALGYTPIDKAGDTMTGYLTLNADPTNLLHAATKQYVDSTTAPNTSPSSDTVLALGRLGYDPATGEVAIGDGATVWSSLAHVGSSVRGLTTQYGEAVNILDFGGDRTGIADCSAATNTALATGKPVFFPEGDYLFNGLTAITSPDGAHVRVFGAGIGRTRFNWTHSAAAQWLFVVPNSATLNDVTAEFHDFSVVGDYLTNAQSRFNRPPGVVVGGTATAGDVATITIASSSIVGSPISVSYTVQSGDTLDSIRAGLAAAVNASTAITDASVFAQPTHNACAVFTKASVTPRATLTITASVSGGATCTLSASSSGTAENVKGAISIQCVKHAIIRNVEVRECGSYGFAVINSENVLVTNNKLLMLGRDAITVQKCMYQKICDNIIRYVDDDAISVYVASGGTPKFWSAAQQNTICTGNMIADSNGIIVSGLNYNVSCNQMDRIRHRGVLVVNDTHSTRASVGFGIISGNTMTNITDRDTIDGRNSTCTYLGLWANADAGSFGAPPGMNDPAAGAVVPLYQNVYAIGASAASAGGCSTIVIGNSGNRLLGSGAPFNQGGGQYFWSQTGWIKGNVTDAMVGRGTGTVISNIWSDVLVCDNNISGVSAGFSIGASVSSRSNRNIRIKNNSVVDFSTAGVVFTSGGSTNKPLFEIVGNTFDGDPYRTHSSRYATNSNAWSDNTYPCVIATNNIAPVIFRDNNILNVSRIADGSYSLLAARSNNVLCQASSVGYSSSNLGVGNVPQSSRAFTILTIDGNVSNDTFGEINTVPSEAISIGVSIPGGYKPGRYYAPINQAPANRSIGLLIGCMRSRSLFLRRARLRPLA
jgi:hypothetical protein